MLKVLSKIVVELQHFAESVTNLSLALRFSSNSCAHAQNYGEWWRIEEICEKLSKSKKFVKKTPFSSKSAESSPRQYNKKRFLLLNNKVILQNTFYKETYRVIDIWFDLDRDLHLGGHCWIILPQQGKLSQ